MFNRARWWSEKNKIKAVFKLQFHASQLPKIGGDGLIVSIVPADAGKPTVRSEKAPVRDGSCLWENPVYETVKFNRDPKSGKIQGKKYYFVVGTGSSKAQVVGEASIDFSSYSEATKVSLVSLPLKDSKTEALLHVSIQRMHESAEQRVNKGIENAKSLSKDQSYQPQLGDTDEVITRRKSVEVTPSENTVPSIAGSTVNYQVSSGSDITLSSSESSSGIWEPQMKKNIAPQELKSDAPAPISEQNQTSWDWVENSAGEGSTDDSSGTRGEIFPKNLSKEDPEIAIEKLKSDVAALSRQAEKSELELQALRRQIVKENKKGQDLWKEVVCLKEERDALKGECEQYKASQGHTKEGNVEDSGAMVKELRQELDHAKELNGNLHIQLQKTQDSNAELILAVRDLEEMLQQKNGEIPNQSDDDEQKALEELVKEHSDAKEAQLLEQQIMDLNSEIEIYKRDKDELQMQLEQLALDYEITKQENHDLLYRMEQCQVQENLTTAHELETQMENLENELERRSKEYADSLVTINELEAHAMSLEDELEKQSQGFEADIEMLTNAKVEQEQRAVRAEEMLKKLQRKNADTAERLQEEFRMLSSQMASTFEANEKLAAKALAEANGLRVQKSRLEEILRITSEEFQSVKDQYETRLCQLGDQVAWMTNQIEKMEVEIVDKSVQLDYQKKHTEETLVVMSEKNLQLKEEITMHKAKIEILSEDKESMEALRHELEQMRKSIKEKELLLEKGNNKSIELKNRATVMQNEAEERCKELSQTRCLLKEKESMLGNLWSEVDFLQAQITELKRSLLTSELEKEKLRKQVSQLSSDLKKRSDVFKIMDKKTKDGVGQGSQDTVKVATRTSKPLPHGSKEIANLKERIKCLEGQIKVKETALEKSTNAFLENKKDLQNKILELEEKLKAPNQSSLQFCTKEAEEKPQTDDYAATSMDRYINELKSEMAVLKERNTSMEEELNDMHDRYSEISLKFAEVEGERQQLAIKLRNHLRPQYRGAPSSLL